MKSNAGTEPIIKVEHVDMYYDRGKEIEVHALKDINLEIEKGDLVAFFGPSGCGKTTLLHAIAGIDRYQNGKVLINGRDLTGLTNEELAIYRQTGIGIVFQQFNLVPSLNILQNVALPMAFVGVSNTESEKEAMRLLKRLNMDGFANRYPFELSGGQQQRVGIARALANDPPIIVADEPLGNLDSENANNVLEFIKELSEKDGRTIIMVTHEAWSLRDVKTVFYMKDGAVTGVEKQTTKTTIADSLSKHLYKQLADKETEVPALPPVREEMSSRAISMFLLRWYSLDEIRRFEEFLNSRMNGEIDAGAFREAIDRPYKDGGVGLWKRKAEHISTQVEAIIDQRYDIEAVRRILDTRPELPITEEVRHIRKWLTLEYRGKLSESQLSALDQAISDLVRNYISPERFKKILQRPRSDYGVGLSFRTAQQFTEKMSVISDQEDSNFESLGARLVEREKLTKN